MSINYDAQIDENGQYILILSSDGATELGRIYEIWDAEISEKVNAEYTFSFQTIPTPEIMGLLKPPNIVMVDDDYFRIRTIKKSRSNSARMDVECEHISYRMNKEQENFKGASYYGHPKEIIEKILEDVEQFHFNYTDFWGEIAFDTNASGRRSQIIELAKFIGGEVQFYRFGVSIITRRGHDHGVTLEVGSNVVSLSETIEYDNTESRSSSSYEVEAVDLNFVIDDATGEPMSPEDIHLGDTLHLIDAELDIDKKDRVVGISYDPFKHLLPTIELENNQSDIYNSDWSTSDSNRSAQVFFFKENETVVNVSSAETSILSQDIVNIRDTYYDTSLTLNVVATGATEVTIVFQVAGIRYGEYKHQINHAGNYIIDIDRFINNIEKGTNTIHVLAKTSGTSVTMAKGKATMLIRTSGVLGGATQEKPDKSFTETVSPRLLNITVDDNAVVRFYGPMLVGMADEVPTNMTLIEPTEVIRTQIIPISEFTTQLRASFADMSKYAEYNAPTQESVDEFIDVLNSTNKLFRMITIDDYLCIITTTGTTLYLDQVTHSANSDGIMLICDINGNTTSLGYNYVFTQSGTIHNRETLIL